VPRSVRCLTLAILLPAACACSTLSSPRRSSPTVTLRFDWPERLSARVSHTIATKTPLGDMKVHRGYWLTVGPAEEEGHRRLVPHDIEVSPRMYAGFADPEPTVFVDDEGGFQGIEPSEEMPGMGLLEALPLDPEKEAQVRENIVAVLEQAALEKWDRLVARWRGVTLIPGEPVRLETTMVVGTGMLGREEVAAEERTSIEVGVPCSRGEQERRCVRLLVETEPVGQSKSGTGPMAREQFELVTDPSTLVPYSTRLLRVDRVDWGEEGGTQPLKEFLQMEEYVFTYGAEPAPPGSRSL